MNINATIIVQIFNFFIVYWMLRIFLFKPAITIIEHEQAHEQTMHDIIDQQKKSLAIQEKERQRFWLLCQEYFYAHQPYNMQKTTSLSDIIESTPCQTTPLSADIIVDSIVHVRTALEEKIKHVH